MSANDVTVHCPLNVVETAHLFWIMDTNPGVGCRVKRNNSLIKSSAGGEGFIMRKRYSFFFCLKLLFFTLVVNLQMMFSVKTMLAFFVAVFWCFYLEALPFVLNLMLCIYLSHKKEHCRES